MIMMAEQLRRNKAIKMIKKEVGTLANTPEGKRWAFSSAFEVAHKMFYGGDEDVDFDDVDLSTLYQAYDVSVELGCRQLWRIEDIRGAGDIWKSTARRAIYSAVSLSRRDGPFTAHLTKIYSVIPQKALFAAVAKLRQDGMVVSRKRFFRMHGKRAPLSEGNRSADLLLSYFYRHFFYHHYHVTLPKETHFLVETLAAHPDDWHNVLSDTPGNVPALIALSWKKQVYFDLTVPSNVVKYSENDDNQTGSRADGTGDGGDEDDWPVIVFSSANLLQNEADEDDFDLGLTPFQSENHQLDNRQTELKTETSDTEAVRLSCASANKWTLYHLRQERLRACETSDSRTISMRVRDLTLNSCTLKAKLSANYKQNDSTEQAKVREAMNRLVTGAAVVDKRQVAAQRCGSEDQTERMIRQMLEEKGQTGMTLDELQQKLGDADDVLQYLNKLIQCRDAYVCGVAKKRYVLAAHIDAWTVSSLRFSKHERSRGQVASTSTSSAADVGGEPVTFMPRPWLKPDGTLNRPMLRWLSEGIFLRVMAMPGLTDGNIQEHFAAVLYPRETDELIEFLISIGCLSRVENEFSQRKQRLFGPPIVEKVTATSYHVSLDGVTKFAAAFAKTPMPDFVSSLLDEQPISDRESVFGRRRLPVTPYDKQSQ